MENKIKEIIQKHTRCGAHTTEQCMQIIKTSLHYFRDSVKEYVSKGLLDIHSCKVAAERRQCEAARASDNYAAASFNCYIANLRRAKEGIAEFYNAEANADRKLILGFVHEAVEGVLKQYDRDI